MGLYTQVKNLCYIIGMFIWLRGENYIISNYAMQLYLNTKLDQRSLIDQLNTLLGLRVETIEQPDEEATAFMMLTEYETGFPTGINVSWNGHATPKTDYLNVAKQLASRYRTQVATDLPRNDRYADNPFYWYVIEANGTVAKIAQETEDDSDQTGLVLNGYYGTHR